MYRKERRIYNGFLSAILTLRRVAFQGSRAWAFLTYKDDIYTSISVQKSVSFHDVGHYCGAAQLRDHVILQLPPPGAPRRRPRRMRSARPARLRSRVATPSATPQRFQDFTKDFKISRRFQDFTKDFTKISRFQQRFQISAKISRFQLRFQL